MGWICTCLGAYLLHLFLTFANTLATLIPMELERLQYYFIIYELHQLVFSLNALGPVFLDLVSDLFRACFRLLQAAVATLFSAYISP